MNQFATKPVLKVQGLSVDYRVGGRGSVRAVDAIDLEIAAGETLALVGESGCGKSSVARAVMQLVPASQGTVGLEGVVLSTLSRRALRKHRHRFQMIFQDPISSLNPRRRVRDILEAPLKLNGTRDKQVRQARVEAVLELVGLDQSVLDRYPHEFSGGQCQRISIARALVLEPRLLVCDEPVSALDVSVRAHVLNVLNDLRQRLGLSMFFISHDLSVVRNVADRVAVMYLGRICEVGDADSVLEHPAHPYTSTLISAIPVADPDARPSRIRLMDAEPPSPLDMPPGCRFATRCPVAQANCSTEEPQLVRMPDGRQVACHYPFSMSSDASTTSGEDNRTTSQQEYKEKLA